MSSQNQTKNQLIQVLLKLHVESEIFDALLNSCVVLWSVNEGHMALWSVAENKMKEFKLFCFENCEYNLSWI